MESVFLPLFVLIRRWSDEKIFGQYMPILPIRLSRSDSRPSVCRQSRLLANPVVHVDRSISRVVGAGRKHPIRFFNKLIARGGKKVGRSRGRS